MSTNYKIPSAKDLLSAGVHFGHQTRRWNPKMEQYIYAAKKNIHIVDLEKTEQGLKDACEKLYQVASQGQKIILVGTKRQAKEIIEIESKRCGALYVSERWIGGTITNIRIIKKNIDKLVKLKADREAGEFKKYTKKERLMIDRKIQKLELLVGGIVGLNEIPGAIFIIDPKREHTAVKEAKNYNVPIAALVDTNTNPDDIDYVIPGNDDAIRSVALIVKTVADCIGAGYQEFAKSQAELKDKKVKEAKASEVASKKEEKTEQPAINVTVSASPIAVKDAGKSLVGSKDISSEVQDVEPMKEETEKDVKDTKEKTKKTASKKTKSTKETKTKTTKKSETKKSTKDSKTTKKVTKSKKSKN